MITDLESSPDQVQALVRLLLQCRWSITDHLALRLTYTKRNPQGYDALLTALHQAFPYVPSATQLHEFLLGRPKLLRGLRWKQFSIVHARRLLATSVMQPTAPPIERCDIPNLPTVGTLADQLLHVPQGVLDWLVNPRVAHYTVATIAKRSRAATKFTTISHPLNSSLHSTRLIARLSPPPAQLGEVADEAVRPTSAGGGRARILEQPKRQLKAAQRDILREILRWVPAHPAAHGFVRGRSVLTFTEPHVGQAAVLRMDLQDFFPSITAARVSAVFRSLGYPYSVGHVLTCLCTTSTPELAISGIDGSLSTPACTRVRTCLKAHRARRRWRTWWPIVWMAGCRDWLRNMAASTRVMRMIYCSRAIADGNAAWIALSFE